MISVSMTHITYWKEYFKKWKNSIHYYLYYVWFKANINFSMLIKIRIFFVTLLTTLIDLITFYPKLKKAIIQNLGHPPQLVLDIGGNKGQSISFFLKLNNNTIIYSFEPLKSHYNHLVMKYKSFDNITISNKGISSHIGKKRFYENILDLTSSFEKLDYDSEYLKYKTSSSNVAMIIYNKQLSVSPITTHVPIKFVNK